MAPACTPEKLTTALHRHGEITTATMAAFFKSPCFIPRKNVVHALTHAVELFAISDVKATETPCHFEATVHKRAQAEKVYIVPRHEADCKTRFPYDFVFNEHGVNAAGHGPARRRFSIPREGAQGCTDMIKREEIDKLHSDIKELKDLVEQQNNAIHDGDDMYQARIDRLEQAVDAIPELIHRGLKDLMRGHRSAHGHGQDKRARHA